MNLTKIRSQKGLTQVRIAKLVNVDASTVAKWEAGISKPRADTLIALSKVLDCTVDELLGDEKMPQ